MNLFVFYIENKHRTKLLFQEDFAFPEYKSETINTNFYKF